MGELSHTCSGIICTVYLWSVPILQQPASQEALSVGCQLLQHPGLVLHAFQGHPEVIQELDDARLLVHFGGHLGGSAWFLCDAILMEGR